MNRQVAKITTRARAHARAAKTGTGGRGGNRTPAGRARPHTYVLNVRDCISPPRGAAAGGAGGGGGAARGD